MFRGISPQKGRGVGADAARFWQERGVEKGRETDRFEWSRLGKAHKDRLIPGKGLEEKGVLKQGGKSIRGGGGTDQ